MQLTVHTKILNAPTKEPPEPTELQRSEWIKKIQAELARPDANEHFHADFETEVGNLHLQARRYRTSIAGLWTSGKWSADVPQEVVGVSVLLRGKDGKDDADAMNAFKSIDALKHFAPKDFTEIQAQNRPCLGVFYTDPAWYESGVMELATSALALSIMAAPGSIPTMEAMDRKVSPEEEAEIQQELQNILDVFEIIQRDWATRKKLRYTVRPSEKIDKSKPISEMMHITFWTGVQGQGRTLSVDGVVALFLMLQDYIEKVPNLHHMRTPQTKHRISLRHEPTVIASVLSQITMSEPE